MSRVPRKRSNCHCQKKGCKPCYARARRLKIKNGEWNPRPKRSSAEVRAENNARAARKAAWMASKPFRDAKRAARDAAFKRNRDRYGLPKAKMIAAIITRKKNLLY